MSDSEHDNGIGVGRGRALSSSSTESTPDARKRTRSFSPASEDGELDRTLAPSQDTTSGPEERRAILRQPVGFSWSSNSIGSASLQTYEEPPNPPSRSMHYLPGQEIPGAHSKRGRAPRGKNGSNSASRRPRKNGHFSSQTNRFRLQSTPLPTPPISLQPDTSINLVPNLGLVAAVSPHLQSATNSISSGPSGPTLNILSMPPAAATVTDMPTKEPKSSKAHVTVSRRTGSKKQANQRAGPSRSSGQTPAGSGVEAHSSPIPSKPQESERSSYYRRDYENGQPLEATQAHPSEAARMLDQLAANQARQQQGRDATGSNPKRLRMVTILIQDVRNEVIDYQLAEVKVFLKPADDPTDGFWADAEELCTKLQGSPSRIDGPARIYTLRGKYRQIILRVTEDNVDHCVTANVIITPDRTIDIVVEELPTAGVIPLPPRVPVNQTQTQSSDPEQASRHQRQLNASSIHEHLLRTRARSPAYTVSEPSRYGHHLRSTSHRPREQSLSAYSANTPSGPGSPSYASTISTLSPASKRQRLNDGSEYRTLHEDDDYDGTSSSSDEFDDAPRPRKLPSPAAGANQETVDRYMENYMTRKLFEETGYRSFSNSTSQPATVPRALSQYRFVKQMIEKFSGQHLRSRYIIEEHHILRALGIRDPGYSKDCHEFLDLVELYGPGGSRVNHQVTEMCLDEERTGEGLVQELLRLMRQLDQKWRAEQRT